MNCPECDSENSDRAKFCSECGTKLAVHPAPGPESLPPPSQPPDSLGRAERRRLTVMFCDLVGSTQLSSKLDPEDLLELIRAYQEACAHQVHELGGHIAQYLGDGILVYFGYPRAFEDGPYRAVLAALRIIKAVKNFDAGLALDASSSLSVRVGVHTGLAVVGDVGSGDRQEHLAVGETPNIAARIEAHAEPNTVLVSQATYERVKGAFRFEFRGAQELKGCRRPMALHQVIDEVERSSSIRKPRSVESPFVGRQSESRRLEHLWERVTHGRSGIALVTGEAGIGKSRLIEALKKKVAERQDAEVSEFCCAQLFAHSAFHPLIQALRDRLQEAGTLGRMLEGFSPKVREALPVFASLLGLEPSDAQTPEPPLPPQKQLERTREALVGWLLESTGERPTLMVWEDIHWADPSTLEIVQAVVAQAEKAPLMLVLSARPEFEPSFAGQMGLERVDLLRLDREEAERIIVAACGEKELPHALVREIIRKADGVPLFVEELTHNVLESELLEDRGGHFALRGSLKSLVVPATLQESLMARLDRLQVGRSTIQLAATLGRDFSYRMLVSVFAGEEEDLRRHLEHLVEAELLNQDGAVPDARYEFRHAMIQETAYKSLLRSTRQQFHRDIALVLERKSVNEQWLASEQEAQGVLSRLAHHWSRSIDRRDPEPASLEKAVDFLMRAGDRSLALNAYQEASTHFEEALHHVNHYPAGVERDERELALQVRLSNVFKATRGWASPEVKVAYDRARDLCLKLDNRLELAPVLFGLWGFHLFKAEYGASLERATECFLLAESVGDPDLMMEAHCALSSCEFWLGRLAESLRHAQRVHEIFDPQVHEAHRLQYGQDPRIVAEEFIIWVLWFLGRDEMAVKRNTRMLALAGELSHPFSTAIALNTALGLQRSRNEFQSCHETSARMITLSQEMGFPNYEIIGRVLRGWALAGLGRASDAVLETVRRDYGRFHEVVGGVAFALISCVVAEMYRLAGRPRESLEVIQSGLAAVARHAERPWETELHCLKGEILLESRADSPAAETALRQALDLSTQMWQAPYLRRAATGLVSLLKQTGNGEEAEHVEAQARQALGRAHQDADRLLRELGIDTGGEPPSSVAQERGA